MNAILKDFRTTYEVSLPGIPESKLTMVTDLLVREAMSYKETGNQYEDAVAMMCLTIREWNLKDEQGNLLPINKESLGLLTIDDFTYLSQEIAKHQKEEKKSSLNSPPSL